MKIELGSKYRTVRNEVVIVTEILVDFVEAVIIQSNDPELINQYDIFLNTSLVERLT